MASIEQIDVDKVLVGLKRAAATAENEEELRIRDSGILQSEVISKLGIPSPRHEVYTFVTGGRIDALYGHVVIEYKAPGKLLREPDVAKAKEQLIGYIKEEAEVEGRFKLFLGVILADRIGFVRYDEKTKNWLIRGPYDLNRETVLRLVEAIRGLRRKKLAVDELLKDFGPKSDMAVNMVNVLYGKVVGSKSLKVEALFNDWKRLFSQVCAYSPEKLKGLEAEYGLTGKVDYSALLFAVHTYYALVMKLLAAEVAYLFGAGKWLKSYVAELEDANMKGLDAFKRALEDLESGGVFRKFLNITNFIEGDYFSWYLEELDQETANKIADLAKKLADYEPATPVLEPEYTRDLLKRLYQNLVPKKIRHDLGEYYTPDWLADLLLNEVGLTCEGFEKYASEKGDTIAPLNLRVLDPACGSGTFLILAIKRFREYAEGHYLKDVLASYVLRNVVGFDLNPLAVLTARTNYLLTIADLLAYAKGPIEIPVYLADSIMVETRTTLTGVSYAIKPYVGVFELPKNIVDRGILGKLLEAVDKYVRMRYKLADFSEVAGKELDLSDEELKLVGTLYKTFLKLEEEGRNHVWTAIIKNAFAPLTIVNSYGKFDYVVGNPPWINWENLPESYREETKKLWDYYGLLKKTKGMGLGKVKKDMAMLFVTRCLDKYVNDYVGKLSFLIPFTTYKTQAGGGFRNYLANKCNILKIHDLVELFPFEGAINRTSMILIEKRGRTDFPISCIMWHNPRSEGIDQDFQLEEIKKSTKQYNMILVPIRRGKPDTSWMITSKEAYSILEKIMMPSAYTGNCGIKTAYNSIYWLDILSGTPDGILIENIGETGKRKSERCREIIERELVYPLVRGRNVKMWYFDYASYIVVPHDPKTGKPLDEKNLRTSLPKTFNFFLKNQKELAGRSIHKLWGKRNPFYSLYDIGNYTFKDFKVAWKHIAGKISGKGEFSVAVISPVEDKWLGIRCVMPDFSVTFASTNDLNEAHYMASVLNSSFSRLIISGYTIETEISTHVLENVCLPKFDSKNKTHLKLAELSKKAHELAKKYYEQNAVAAQEELKKVEEEIEKTVAKLYGINDLELTEIEKTLKALRGEEIEGEIVEEESMEVIVDFLNAVASPNVAGSFEVAITNPPKDIVRIELQLPDRKVELETDKEQETIKVKTPPLPAGEHKIPYKIIAQDKVAKGEFTLHVKEKKRFRKDESLTGKLDELLEES
jgi:methylase of polypeptide subunit release factors